MSDAAKPTADEKKPAAAAAPAPAPAPGWFGAPRCLILGLLAAILLALLATAWWRAAAPRSAAIGGGRARLRGGAWAARGGCNCVAPPM
jgi:hypothetical protein